jgi:hypothetical protein
MLAMSRLNVAGNITEKYSRKTLFDALTAIQNQLNNLSGGLLKAKTNATATMPTTGTYAVGDFVPNSNISELGTAGNKYILTGWIVITSPNTFRECRCLTGN